VQPTLERDFAEAESTRGYLRSAAHALRLRGPLAADPTARMLYVLVLALAIWYAIWTIILVPLYPDQLVRLGVAVLAELGPVAALILLRHGLLRQATLVYLAGTWLYATVRIALGSGIQSTTMVIYVTLPILATWLLGYRAALWTAGVCLGSSLFFALLEMAGFHHQHAIPVSPLGTWSTLVQVTLIGAVPIAQILQALRDALAQSCQSQDELQKYREHLEHLVEQRTAELVAARDQAESARDQAESANRAKSLFLANMSHELRTPLNSILGFSTLLRDQAVSAQQYQQSEIIWRSGDHLLSLIDDVLDMAKIEAGKQKLTILPCDLISTVRDVTDMIRERAQTKNLALICSASPDFPPCVRADAAKLRQVLINLLGNAVKFTDQGSVTLRLSATPADRFGRLRLRFEVEDTGPGIAPDDHARIFEPFSQAGRPAIHVGSGLGLTITRHFVEMMGGTVGIRSAPGRGALFTVELPTELAQEAEVTGSKTGRDHQYVLAPGQPEHRVLVVEDDPGNAILLQQMLSQAGFQVSVAANGAAGVETFAQCRPHFIWMDLRMPVLGGIEASQRIRELDGGREVKIAAMSASAFSAERQQVLAAGLDDFVRKPFLQEEIFECMARHLGARYRQWPAATIAPAAQPGQLRPEALAVLPQELRRELANAVTSLNRERILSVIDHIGGRDEALAEVLRHLCKEFAYTAMYDAIESMESGISSTPGNSDEVGGNTPRPLRDESPFGI
jgi:signal transduction histidine kinase/CheY-like chemotaxis protein